MRPDIEKVNKFLLITRLPKEIQQDTGKLLSETLNNRNHKNKFIFSRKK